TEIAQEKIVAKDSIPFGHKLSTRAIKKGEPVRKYGQVIGVATDTIEPGRHVHVQNVAFSDLRPETGAAPELNRNEPPRCFMCRKRDNGKVATRTYVGVLTSVNCSATVARHIAEAAQKSGLLDEFPNVDGIVPITHHSGCGMATKGEGYDLLTRTLWGTAANP